MEEASFLEPEVVGSHELEVVGSLEPEVVGSFELELELELEQVVDKQELEAVDTEFGYELED